MIGNNKVDLSYIYEISDGDREFIKEMLETFLKITPETIAGLDKAKSEKNWKEVGRLAHKIKPTIMLIGDDSLSAKVRVVENNAKQESNLKELPQKITDFSDHCHQVVADINELIETDSY